MEVFREPLFAADRFRELYVGRPYLDPLEVRREDFDADCLALDSSRLKTPVSEENRSISVGLLDF